LLWWVAFTAEIIAAVLETIDRDYLKATGLYSLSLAFLILALNKGSEGPLWRKILLLILGLLAIGLFLYRFVWAPQG
jgi:H+/Cl- antiporter ClcA